MKSRVLGGRDQRSDSLVVGAAASLMPQIPRLIEELDSNSARKIVVRVYQMKSANAQQTRSGSASPKLQPPSQPSMVASVIASTAIY